VKAARTCETLLTAATDWCVSSKDLGLCKALILCTELTLCTELKPTGTEHDSNQPEFRFNLLLGGLGQVTMMES
jgi:hypothetical protein